MHTNIKILIKSLNYTKKNFYRDIKFMISQRAISFNAGKNSFTHVFRIFLRYQKETNSKFCEKLINIDNYKIYDPTRDCFLKSEKNALFFVVVVVVVLLHFS